MFLKALSVSKTCVSTAGKALETHAGRHLKSMFLKPCVEIADYVPKDDRHKATESMVHLNPQPSTDNKLITKAANRQYGNGEYGAR